MILLLTFILMLWWAGVATALYIVKPGGRKRIYIELVMACIIWPVVILFVYLLAVLTSSKENREYRPQDYN